MQPESLLLILSHNLSALKLSLVLTSFRKLLDGQQIQNLYVIV